MLMLLAKVTFTGSTTIFSGCLSTGDSPQRPTIFSSGEWSALPALFVERGVAPGTIISYPLGSFFFFFLRCDADMIDDAPSIFDFFLCLVLSPTRHKFFFFFQRGIFLFVFFFLWERVTCSCFEGGTVRYGTGPTEVLPNISSEVFLFVCGI